MRVPCIRVCSSEELLPEWDKKFWGGCNEEVGSGVVAHWSFQNGVLFQMMPDFAWLAMTTPTNGLDLRITGTGVENIYFISPAN